MSEVFLYNVFILDSLDIGQPYAQFEIKHLGVGQAENCLEVEGGGLIFEYLLQNVVLFALVLFDNTFRQMSTSCTQ